MTWTEQREAEEEELRACPTCGATELDRETLHVHVAAHAARFGEPHGLNQLPFVLMPAIGKLIRKHNADAIRELQRLRADNARLAAEVEELKHLHANQMQNAYDQQCRAEKAERCARQMLDLWPAEYFATVGPIVEDNSWLEDVT
jgi:hypothetical protein